MVWLQAAFARSGTIRFRALVLYCTDYFTIGNYRTVLLFSVLVVVSSICEMSKVG